jgi:hypothetical protein
MSPTGASQSHPNQSRVTALAILKDALEEALPHCMPIEEVFRGVALHLECPQDQYGLDLAVDAAVKHAIENDPSLAKDAAYAVMNAIARDHEAKNLTLRFDDANQFEVRKY